MGTPTVVLPALTATNNSREKSQYVNYNTPFRLVCRPLLRIAANAAASDGFSATINAVFIIMNV